LKPRFSAAAKFRHDQAPRTAVLLVNLGTPSAPNKAAVKTYLREFLSDPRVVEIPKLVWSLILNGIILNLRPAISAEKYRKIWSPDGSPLLANTAKQASLLRGVLGQAGHSVEVAFAMRYGAPSVRAVMRNLREQNVERLLVVPMYPQYSGATTASTYDAVFAELAGWRNLPELRLIKHFHDHDAYLAALAARIKSQWQREQTPDKLLISFHGMPRRTLELGDPYHCECLVTARKLAERLELSSEQYQVSFQSRFGKAQWLQPYTDASLQAMARSGAQRVDVVCPGFVADCLETLEEIAIEGQATFKAAGGKEFRYLPCLNDSPVWIEALGKIVLQHMAGWPTERLDSVAALAARDAYQQRKKRAAAQGAQV
jgi:protoporphyrin/coproporphyrin ferrochelatase